LDNSGSYKKNDKTSTPSIRYRYITYIYKGPTNLKNKKNLDTVEKQYLT